MNDHLAPDHVTPDRLAPDHLTPRLLSALADGELSAPQLSLANQHLAACPSCTTAALAQAFLKNATAKAGHRFDPPPHLREQLQLLVRQESAPAPSRVAPRPARKFAFAALPAALLAACALLLVFAGTFLIQRQARQRALLSSESASLVTEACDQHVATLAANQPPQVLSSDRHTVKPWFQGKIPFSFNLPENLPADTKLEGANLTYLGSRPAALLLYSIGKHRVSVFVQQAISTRASAAPTAEHAGFHVAAFTTRNLDVLAVSDVDPARLANLADLLQQAQTATPPPPQ